MNYIDDIARKHLPTYSCNVCDKVDTEYILYLYAQIPLPNMPGFKSYVLFVCSDECIEYVKLLIC